MSQQDKTANPLSHFGVNKGGKRRDKREFNWLILFAVRKPRRYPALADQSAPDRGPGQRTPRRK